MMGLKKLEKAVVKEYGNALDKLENRLNNIENRIKKLEDDKNIK